MTSIRVRAMTVEEPGSRYQEKSIRRLPLFSTSAFVYQSISKSGTVNMSRSSSWEAPSLLASHDLKEGTCDVCNAVDNRRYLTEKLSRNVSLGAWGEIVQRQSCPFCRLVVRSLRANSSQTLLHPSDLIALNNHESWELGIKISPHDRLKSDAYSNMLDLRSMAKKCSDIAHRFVVFVEDYPEVTAYIQYLAPQDHQKEAMWL